jgi:4-hydroxy-3-methylbut-2-enyl diphosphate reductase
MLTMLAEGGLDVMVVIGGYNSSNTQALARICAATNLPTFHIDSPEAVTAQVIRHRPIGSHHLTDTAGWLPPGAVRVGLTAGASTPNNVVGEVVARILAARGSTVAELGPA